MKQEMKTTLNFGALKDSITKKAAIEMARDNRNATLVDFMEAVKKSPVLKKQFLLYKNFERTKPFESARLAERFIEQNLQLMNEVSWPQLQDANAHLRQNLLGGPDEATVMASKDNEQLFENLNTIIEAKLNKNFKHFDKDAKAYGELVEHMTRKVPVEEMNQEKERPELNKMWRYVTKNALGYFNERYEALSEDERTMFKALIGDRKEKTEAAERLRDELSSMLSERIKKSDNQEDTVILETFLGKVKKEVPVEKTASDEYLLSLFELKGTLMAR